MPLTLKKLVRYIAFGLSIRSCMRLCFRHTVVLAAGAGGLGYSFLHLSSIFPF